MNRTLQIPLTLILLSSSAPTGFAQTPPPKNAPRVCGPALGDRVGYRAGSPFIATWTFKLTEKNSEQQMSVHNGKQTIARDSKGRTYFKSESTDTQAHEQASFEVNNQVEQVAFGWASGVQGFRREIVLHHLLPQPKPDTPEYEKRIIKAPWLAAYWAVPLCVAFDPEIKGIFSYRAGDYKIEPLATKSIQGVQAEGILASRTYPAGYMGYDNPVTVTNELWYSDDLQLTLSETFTDPRSGTWIRQISSLERTEPAASLFRPPIGYSIREIDQAANSKSQQ